MDLSTQLEQVNFGSGQNANRLNFLDLRFSNLPLDYLNGVLPTAQFGSESVVSLSGKDLETSSDYKKWTTDSNPIPDNSDVLVSQYHSGNVANLTWQKAGNGGALYIHILFLLMHFLCLFYLFVRLMLLRSTRRFSWQMMSILRLRLRLILVLSLNTLMILPILLVVLLL